MSRSTSLGAELSKGAMPVRVRGARRGWRDPGDRALAAWLLAPAGLLLLAIVFLPALRLLWTSLFDVSLPGTRPVRFVGLENYVLALSDPVILRALRNTVAITLLTVPGALVGGMALALLARAAFRDRWGGRAALLLPWAMPPAFVGLGLASVFDAQGGLLNALLRSVGHYPHNWLGDSRVALLLVCLGIIWKGAAFFALVLLARLEAVPAVLYEAAAVDGAGPIRRFLHVTLPALRPAVAMALAFCAAAGLAAFAIPATLLPGGPLPSTGTLAMAIRQYAAVGHDFGIAAAIGTVLALLGLGVAALGARAARALP